MNNQDIAVVCCYFNPCHYKSKLRNYKLFRKGIKASGVKLLTVELAFGDDKFELNEFSDVLQLRTKDIMWHKERLLNIGITELIKQGYKKIAWLDADIIFEDFSWVEKLSKELEKYPLCQAFSQSYGVRKKYHKDEKKIGSVKYYYKTGKISYRFARSGIAWAARADVLKKVPLYNHAIIGGADTLILLASYYSTPKWNDNIKNQQIIKQMPLKFLKHYINWAKKWGALINGKVSYINCSIKDIYHGSFSNRKYSARNEILLKHNYNPSKDLTIAPNKCLKWNSNKPQMHQEIKNYFKSRNEDN